MAIPTKITVLSIAYTVEIVPDLEMEGNYGKVDFDHQIIKLSDKMKGNFQRETLFHEVLHIIDYHTTGAGSVLKERDIQRLSAGVFDTLVQNPSLMKGVKKRSS